MYNDAWTLKISYFCSNEKKKKKKSTEYPEEFKQRQSDWYDDSR